MNLLPETLPAPATLLYVEDEDNDVLFLRRAFKRVGAELDLQVVSDGDKAVAYLAGEAPFQDRPTPQLVLLDLNLPARSGFEVLEWFREQPALQGIPVVVFSSSGRPEDRERARRLGASDYLLKPTSTTQLADIARELWTRWLVRPALRSAALTEPDLALARETAPLSPPAPLAVPVHLSASAPLLRF